MAAIPGHVTNKHPSATVCDVVRYLSNLYDQIITALQYFACARNSGNLFETRTKQKIRTFNSSAHAKIPEKIGICKNGIAGVGTSTVPPSIGGCGH